MRLKLLLLLLFVVTALTIAPGSLYGQNVSTEIEKRAVLVENFTGIHCGYCPQGHAIVHDLMAAQPGNVYTIAVHAGSFAIPNSDEPNFIVEDGIAINQEFNIDNYGYPSGTVNRAILEGSMVFGRGAWIKASKTQHSEDAPVNLHLSSTYNGSTRELTITVEGYYTMEITDDVHYLSVAYVQDNIKGPQSGGLVGSDYMHSHMLKDYITDVWGDVIESPEQGQFFTKEYTYTLPQSVNEVPVLPEDIEVIAFVSRTKREILNVIGGKPDYINYEKPLSAILSKPEFEVKSTYAYNYFDAQLKNESNTPVEKAGFKITINGDEQEAEWTGHIHSFSKQAIQLAVEAYNIENTNTYSIELISLNGQTIASNTINGTFGKLYETTPKIVLEIQTDQYADENRFMIKNRAGETVKELGPYETGKKAIYTEEVELHKGQIYCIEITDDWGDGMMTPRGYLKLFTEDDKLLIQDNSIDNHGTRHFIRTSLSPTVISSPNPNQAKHYFNKEQRQIEVVLASNMLCAVSLYNISGQLMHQNRLAGGRHVIPTLSFPSGCYILSIQQGTQTETHKILIH